MTGSRRSHITALLANLAILALFVWAVHRFGGWEKLIDPWQRLPTHVLALAFAGMLASYAVRALRIYLAEKDIPRGRYGACLRLVLLNNAMNWMLPSRSGEVSFPLLMHRWFGIDFVRAAGTLFWLRLLDLQVLASITAVSAGLGWLGAGGTIIGIAIAALAIAAPPLLFLLRRPLAARVAGHTGRIPKLLHRAISGLPDKASGVALDIGLTWFAWTIKLAALGGVLARLADLPFSLGLLGAIGGDLSTVLPVHAPGGFGTYEAGEMLMLAPGAAPSATLLAAAVDLHLLVLTSALTAGALAWVAGVMPRSGRS